MRIAVVTSLTRGGGTNGEDVAAMEQSRSLRAGGHDVLTLWQDTDSRQAGSRWYPARAAATIATGRGPSPLARLREFGPDVVHIHNTWPNIGRRWVRDLDAALVLTMHSYRPVCAAATFFRDGAECTECLDRTPLSAVRHGCYQGRLRSVPYAVAASRSRHDVPLQRADRIIALNPTMVELLSDIGVPRGRVVLADNTLSREPAFAPDAPAQPRWLVAARLTEAKGVLRLVRAFPTDQRLDVVGDGPQSGQIRTAAGPSVRVRGHVPRAELLEEFGRYTGLIVPSLSFEGGAAPMVYIEALAAGVPVIAFQPCVVARRISEDDTGLVGDWNDVTGTLAAARSRFPQLREQVRAVYEKRYAPDVWLGDIERVYSAARQHYLGRSRP